MINFSQFILILENKIEWFSKNSGLPREHIEKLASIDPNKKRKNLTWLVQQTKRGNIDPNNEDHHSEHFQALKDYESTNGKLGPLTKFNNVDELKQAYADHMKNDWGTKVFDHDGHEIWQSTTKKHLENHGVKTGWCTAIKDGFHQAKYVGSNKSPLFTHYPPDSPKPGTNAHSKGGNKYQFYAGDEGYTGEDWGKKPELGNEHNRPVDPSAHEENYPILKQSQHWNDFRDSHNEWKNSQYEHDDYDDEEPEEDMHELAHSDNHNDRVRAVELGAHRNGNEHLLDDDHTDVKEAILDYGKHRIHGNEREIYQNEMDHIHDNSPIEDEDNDNIHSHIAKYTSNPEHIEKYTKWELKDSDGNSIGDHHYSIAQNRNITSEQLDHIAKNSGNYAAINKVAIHPNTSLETIDHLIKNRLLDKISHAHIFNRRADLTPEKRNEFLDHMSTDTSSARSRASAVHWGTERHRDKLMNDPDVHVQTALATYRPEQKYNHTDINVRNEAARALARGINQRHNDKIANNQTSYGEEHEVTPEEHHMFRHLLSNNNIDDISKAYVADRVSNSIIHNQLKNDPSQVVVRNIIGSTKNPELIKHFVNHPNIVVRDRAANKVHSLSNEHKNDIIDHMADSVHADVRKFALRHSNNPDTLHKLATNPETDYYGHTTIVNNRHVAPHTLDHIENKYKNTVPRTGSIMDNIADARSRISGQ